MFFSFRGVTTRFYLLYWRQEILQKTPFWDGFSFYHSVYYRLLGSFPFVHYLKEMNMIIQKQQFKEILFDITFNYSIYSQSRNNITWSMKTWLLPYSSLFTHEPFLLHFVAALPIICGRVCLAGIFGSSLLQELWH